MEASVSALVDGWRKLQRDAGGPLEPGELVREAARRLAEEGLDARTRLPLVAQAMRRFLVDDARTRGDVDLGRLDEALNRLATASPERGEIVELRYFGGLEVDEIAEALGRSPADVDAEWLRAIEWLGRELGATTGGVLEWSPVLPPLPGSRIGERVGAYEIVRHLGDGGMGTVYLARRADGQFSQDVALKLVKRGMDTDSILGRFRAERQILAGLDHPNICHLLDGGMSDDGLPYFVMERIDGETIEAYCGGRSLAVPERLELFLAVCEAVAYAHRNLVVHRDIKPRNVLVAANGTVKLLDFGIAKLLKPGATETLASARLMTPEYASPEQVSGGAVTTATDVHALGLLLYELLTGVSPFGRLAGNRASLGRVILEEDPPPPSQVVSSPKLRRALRGDLDNIVAMALRKDPARRYPSVDRLAADVRRHLRHEPVTARRDALAYRAAKFVRRHRVGVGLAAAVAVLLAASSIVTAHQAAVADRERDRAEAERDRAQAVSDFVTSLFEVDPLADDEGVADTTPLRDFLTRSEAKVRHDLGDRPDLQSRLLELLCRLHGNLGRLDRARPLCEEALALRAKLGDTGSAELSVVLTGLGTVEQDDGDFGPAEEHFRRALAIREKLYGPLHPDVAEAVNNLAVLMLRVRRPGAEAETERLVRRGLELRRAIFGAEHSDTAQSLNTLASFLYGRRGPGDMEEASRVWREALGIRARRLGEHHPLVAVLRSNLGNALRELGQLDEAEALFKAAIADYVATLGPGNPRESNAWFGLYKTLLARGDLRAAESALASAIAIDEKTLPADHPHRMDGVKAMEALRRQLDARAQ